MTNFQLASAKLVKYLLLTLTLLLGCAGGYTGYNTPECSARATEMTERIVMREYEMWASETEICTMYNYKYHYMARDPDFEMTECSPMPYVVNVECFTNCLTQYYSCLIFHSDGYVVEDVRRFGEERVRRD
jgi:hypothetical protein